MLVSSCEDVVSDLGGGAFLSLTFLLEIGDLLFFDLDLDFVKPNLFLTLSVNGFGFFSGSV